mmetsp:Transcript_24522/g.44347  ORF Transcript_24522/g.44347 Transcript_24522/m.44347 type:complete len:192 (-) Transcript_24522:177-752(-)
MADVTSGYARITAAATELLEAAGIEVASSRQQKISTDIVSFKESVDAKLNTVNQTLVTSRAHIDDKLNSISQHVVNLEERTAYLEEQVANQTKLQALAFAMDHAEQGSFTYRTYTSYSTQQSSALIPGIVLSFRRNMGNYIPEGKVESGEGDESTQKKNFHEALINQIHSLTGTKPKIQKGANGNYAIYYS